MKTHIRTAGSKDGAEVRTHAISGLITRYRMMTNLRNQSTEALERPTVSVKVEDRQTQLLEFFRIYEDLVEVLCDAAQLGVSAALETRFQSARQEMINRYASIRIFLSAYLRSTGEDSRWSARGIRFDAFDSLLAPVNLEIFLQADDGYTISRITRTREALNLYGEHLRQLAQKAK